MRLRWAFPAPWGKWRGAGAFGGHGVSCLGGRHRRYDASICRSSDWMVVVGCGSRRRTGRERTLGRARASAGVAGRFVDACVMNGTPVARTSGSTGAGPGPDLIQAFQAGSREAPKTWGSIELAARQVLHQATSEHRFFRWWIMNPSSPQRIDPQDFGAFLLSRRVPQSAGQLSVQAPATVKSEIQLPRTLRYSPALRDFIWWRE